MKTSHQLTIFTGLLIIVGILFVTSLESTSSVTTQIISDHKHTSEEKLPSEKQSVSKNTEKHPPESSISFSVEARNWEFSQEEISVSEGDSVTITFSSPEDHHDGAHMDDHEHGSKAVHSFTIPELGIDEEIAPGETKTISFKATKKGTYSFFCKIPCGRGHSNMRGTLIIT